MDSQQMYIKDTIKDIIQTKNMRNEDKKFILEYRNSYEYNKKESKGGW